MLDSKEEIERALRALSDRLDATHSPATELAVCGGAALHVRGLMTRGVTRDVDAFAQLKTEGGVRKLVKADPLPDFLIREAAIVARDFGIAPDWLNAGPSSLIDLGLPPGIEARLHAVVYGARLTVHYIDRWDQVHFKLYAAANYGDPGSRHVSDLLALNPKAEELESAARWSLTQDPSPGFRIYLKGCLEHIGHDDVARRI